MTETLEKTFTKKDLEKEWDDGVEYGREQGRLDVFEDLLKIKYATWSVHSVNNKEWSLGDKKLDHPLDLNVDKPLKIIYNYHWYEYDESTKKLESFNEDLYGRAKNNTIGEVWKGIDKLYVKYGLQGTDHKFIESIDIEGNVLKFHTGS
jgi:hypothetical protein|tara:strand:+ start:175 stop:621 length:447 start_codon:yes stop_codon:yes gene_type:complete